MTDEPRRLNLQEQLDRLKAKAPKVTEPVYVSPEEIRAEREGYEAVLRETRWQRTIPERFLHADFDIFGSAHPDVAPRVAGWTLNPRGRNLVLLGPVGVGKSYAAVATARALFDLGHSVAFWSVVDLLDAFRPGGHDGVTPESLARDDVLVLDDLGGERPTEWTSERLYAVINQRWIKERSIIATSNLPATKRVAPKGYAGLTLDEYLGDRSFSRLIGNDALVTRLSGPDRRR